MQFYKEVFDYTQTQMMWITHISRHVSNTFSTRNVGTLENRYRIYEIKTVICAKQSVYGVINEIAGYLIRHYLTRSSMYFI